MKYQVSFTEQAEAEADQAFQWISQDSPASAVSWFNGLVDAIESLASFPERCPLAPESEEVQREIRQLLYGKFRILYFIHAKGVFVLHIRHGAQKYLSPGQV